MPRRFPPPCTVEQIPAGFKIVDANGQALAYVYAGDTGVAKLLTPDEARRVRLAAGAARCVRLALTTPVTPFRPKLARSICAAIIPGSST
jgi:hypothetical protein